MKTKTLKPQKPQTGKTGSLRVCALCRRTLPLTEFYPCKSSGGYDCYCKQCRKRISRSYRMRRYCLQTENSKAPYPLITDPRQDPQVRMELLRAARQRVKHSIERKQALLKQQEYDAFR